MLWRMLNSWAEARPDRIAFSLGDAHLRAGDLLAGAAGLAGQLLERGVVPGDSVGLLLRRGTQLVTSLCGVLGAGGVAVPLNPASRPGEVARALLPCRPRLILCERDLVELLRPTFPCALAIQDVMAAGRPYLALPQPPADPDRAAFILFSTGSTGWPKRVVRTHAMMRAEADQYQAAVRLSEEDVILGVPPIFHSYGLCCVMLSALRSGARARLFVEFQPEAVMTWATRDRATVLLGSPFHYSIMAGLSRRPGIDLSSLRWCISCGAPATEAIISRFRERFGLNVRQLYGASEVGSVTLNSSQDPVATAMSVGTPLPGVRVRVVREDGHDAAPGSAGEVAVSSPAAARRYEDLREMTVRSFRQGWFFSGDLGRLEESGSLHITGRVKLHINAGGNKVDPQEVESVLEEHPAVAEAAVVGVPAAHGLEIVKAAVVLRDQASAEDLRAFCMERLIGYKVPRIIEVRSELPRSPAGKLLRKDLVEEGD